jgi:RND family efflux transporter MFP subunit
MALANIYNVSIMEVEVRLPPREVVWLHSASGGSVNLKGDRPAKARITFDAMGQKITWDGFVSRIKGHMEERTRTLPVVVEVENGYPGRGHPLMPGMFVSVEIQGKKVDDLFLIPQEAIHENETVHVVEEGKINVKQVNILRRMGNKVFVTEGLSDGDKVVTLFPGMATEGMKVRVRPRSDEGGSSG